MTNVILFSAVIAMLGFGFSVPAMAQDITLKFTSQELTLLGKALGMQPYNEVAPLMTKLQNQIIEQQKATEEKKPDEPKK